MGLNIGKTAQSSVRGIIFRTFSPFTDPERNERSR